MAEPTYSKDTTIPLGSVVRVIDSGKGYSTYSQMAAFMNLNNWGVQGSPSRYPKDGETYHVVAKAQHESPSYGDVLGLQREDGKQCMIGIGGVELVAAPQTRSLSFQVIALETELTAVKAERDQLRNTLATISRLTVAHRD